MTLVRAAAIAIGITTLATAHAQVAEGPELPALPLELPPGHVLLDDIILPESALHGRIPYQTNFWSTHVVPYLFNANVTLVNKNRALAAFAEIEAVANVKFVERTTEANYLHIKNSTGNNSFVGQIGGGQTVNIVSWSFRFVIVHELLHALGAWHEQQRPDRDEFVEIVYSNCQPGTEGNFDSIFWVDTFGTYDFDSVMHYDACSFSTCCPAGSTCSCALECVTIRATPAYAEFQWLMGNRDHLSDGDKAWLVFAYGVRDCNGNGVHDYFDIQNGTIHDCNHNGAADGCDGLGTCVGDVDFSCATTVADFNILAANFGAAVTPGLDGDIDGDGFVSVSDFILLTAHYGASCP